MLRPKCTRPRWSLQPNCQKYLPEMARERTRVGGQMETAKELITT